MPNISMKPIIQLKVGDRISPRFQIDKIRVSNWKYAGECPSNFSPFPSGSHFEIHETCTKPGDQWVKAYAPNTHNTMSFKIAGAELSAVFQYVQG